jgi:hypothetical protein
VYSIAGCFRGPTTPIYVNVTVGVMNLPLKMSIFYSFFAAGPQSIALYQRPQWCTGAASASALESAKKPSVVAHPRVHPVLAQALNHPKLQKDKIFHTISHLVKMITSLVYKK